jgi:hypothetical protein
MAPELQHDRRFPMNRTTTVESVSLRAPQDFSLVLGGPLYQLLRRSHLSGDALELARQRTLVIAGLGWLPLLALSAYEGKLLGGVPVPFLGDVEANVRFLIALPLLIVAELVVHRRMRMLVRTFLDRNLIPADEVPRFDAAISSALRLRNSVVAEILLIAFVYGVGVAIFWRSFVAIASTATWYGTPGAGGFTLSLTGMWYAYVSLPLYQFLLVRWYFRLVIWARFLWQVSRLRLTLIPTHPDRVGGLGFLSNLAFAFTPLALAHGAMTAGPIANRIFYVGAALTDFKMQVLVVVLFVLLIVLAPFLVFAPRLAEAKRNGLREYGTLAERYVREFDEKWLRGGAPADEPLVGSGDVQSLADMGGSFDVVKEMRVAPITRDAVLRLVGSTIAPIVPLALTMMSFEELLKQLFGILF